MFSKTIQVSPLVGGIADAFFEGIDGNSYAGDVSLLSTARALLHERMKKVGEHSLSIFARLEGRISVGFNQEDFCRGYIGDTVANIPSQSLSFYNLKCDNNALKAALEALDDPEHGFVKTFPYTEVADLREFVKARADIDARFYLNEDRRVTFVIIGNLNLSKFHFIQSLFPRFVPWFFKDAPVTEDEVRLLRSLTGRYGAEYERCIQAIANQLDFREAMVRKVIGRFGQAAKEAELHSTEDTISQLRASMARHAREYDRLVGELHEFLIKQAGQKIALEEDNTSDLADYFTCNRSLLPLSTSGFLLRFMVTTYADSFDPEVFRTYVENTRSHFFCGYNVSNREFHDIENRRMIFNAIFGDEPKFKLRLCACYQLDVRGTADGISDADYRSASETHLPNPHIHYYACLGNHRRYIEERLRDGDIIGAVDQCVASAKSLNLCESTTMVKLFGSLFSTSRTVLELPNGELLTPSQALEYLKKQKEDENV